MCNMGSVIGYIIIIMFIALTVAVVICSLFGHLIGEHFEEKVSAVVLGIFGSAILLALFEIVSWLINGN